MIIISQNVFLILGLIGFFIFIGIKKFKSEKGNLHIFNHKKIQKEEVFLYLFSMYLIGVCSKVYFPLTIAWGKDLQYNPPEMWLNPLFSIKEIYYLNGLGGFLYQIIGNLIMLSPLAFFLCYFYEESEEILPFGNIFLRRIREFLRYLGRDKEIFIRGKKIPTLKAILKFCFFTSLFIECTQILISLIFPNTKRFFEVNDIICNTLSGALGYYIYVKLLNFNWIRKKVLNK